MRLFHPVQFHRHVQTHGKEGSELSVRCRQAGHTELYKDRALLHSTITLTDALPVRERRHDSEQRREDVGRSAEPHSLLRGWNEPRVQQWTPKCVFSYANKGQRDSDHPLSSNCFQHAPSSSPCYVIEALYGIGWPACFKTEMFYTICNNVLAVECNKMGITCPQHVRNTGDAVYELSVKLSSFLCVVE